MMRDLTNSYAPRAFAARLQSVRPFHSAREPFGVDQFCSISGDTAEGPFDGHFVYLVRCRLVG